MGQKIQINTCKDLFQLKLSLEMKKEKNNLDNLTPEEVGKLFPVRVEPYNPDWEELYEQEKELLIRVLGENVVINIEHFGSTSVVGLAAKPTIDIMVEISSLSNEMKQVLIQKLGTIGYGNMYNAEKENKMTFGKGYDENYAYIPSYHVHIREKGNMPQEEIYFRDYLRQNSEAREEYAKLKYESAKKHQFNREDYTQAKAEFIKKITEQQQRKE